MSKLIYNFVLLITYLSSLAAQVEHPADTVMTSNKTSITEKVLVAPIALWQRISYSTPLLECQFYPSCSNYAAQSIAEKGIFKGTIMAADRIVRCNPAAYQYHLRDRLVILTSEETFYKDGRLIDPVLKSLPDQHNGKSPFLAAAFSSLIPGSGRIYAGRIWDGIFGFLTFSISTKLAYSHLKKGHQIRGGLFSFAALAFYGGEILGAYRAAKTTPSPTSHKHHKDPNAHDEITREVSH
ncbi:MAG: membrane protein insertion efficiency factor YidD [Fidelibacterota bacterium]